MLEIRKKLQHNTMKVATYYTPDLKIDIRNNKNQSIMNRHFRKSGNTFTLPYKPIYTNNRLNLVKLENANFNLLQDLFSIIKPERTTNPISNINIKKSYVESEKACIYPTFQQIYIHPTFLTGLNEVEKKLVLFHECGHLYYKSEYKSDVFAATILYILGYPSYEILKALRKTLSKSKMNDKRAMILINLLKSKNHGRSK